MAQVDIKPRFDEGKEQNELRMHDTACFHSNGSIRSNANSPPESCLIQNQASLPRGSMEVESNGSSEGFSASVCNRICTKLGNTLSQESQIIYLLCELDAAKKSNKNLKAQLKAVTAELNNLKFPADPAARYCPGVLTAMISEIYQAQRERDDAMMARIRLANDERDEALYRLDEIREKTSREWISKNGTGCANIDHPFATLMEADYLLNSESALLETIAESKRKVSAFHAANQPLQMVQETDEDESHVNEEDNKDQESISSSSQTNKSAISYPTSHNSNDSTEPANLTQLRLLQLRLSQEIQAKEEAQASCQRLERLVNVLRKKVNGLALQRQESSDE